MPAANTVALDRIVAVRPIWTRVIAAGDALALPDRALLHAGPPLADPMHPPAPIASSAVLACMHEGWAENESEAEQMIASGTVRLLPGHPFGVVMPLAAIASARTSLVEVSDASGLSARSWSLLASGAGPQLRFGTRDPAVLPRLVWRDGELAQTLASALTEPIDLFAAARAGLEGGDDLHASTTTATAALLARLAPRLPKDAAGRRVSAVVEKTPLFFLTLWMAACRAMLGAAEGVDNATIVTALGANGESVGLRLAGEPTRWITITAAPPAGPRLNADLTAAVSPAVGDSAVIDMAGFGGQRLHAAPEMRALFARWLPEDHARLNDRLFEREHPVFASLGLRVGLDARRVIQAGLTPLVAIAMLAADGRTGLLGRGLYRPPVELFAPGC